MLTLILSFVLSYPYPNPDSHHNLILFLMTALSSSYAAMTTDPPFYSVYYLKQIIRVQSLHEERRLQECQLGSSYGPNAYVRLYSNNYNPKYYVIVALLSWCSHVLFFSYHWFPFFCLNPNPNPHPNCSSSWKSRCQSQRDSVATSQKGPKVGSIKSAAFKSESMHRKYTGEKTMT